MSLKISSISSLGRNSVFKCLIVCRNIWPDFLNLFKIKRKINETVNEILKFKPDILFSVDSPDFTLRVAKEVKKKDPNIKTIHFVAPQVWVWREHRVKQLKLFLDHVLHMHKILAFLTFF